ncbi:hypothetical protein ACFC1B_30535 [Streptomyces xiamenensis]|uniref:hypothetical protein n=1 Tax=Streptomyces TaxID=1883 RepID=UPI0004C52481|nr:hypothetical protein [Streptomyces sp. NRRL F-2890]
MSVSDEPVDLDSRTYESLQRLLGALYRLLTEGEPEVERIRQATKDLADRAVQLAIDIDNADLESSHVTLTENTGLDLMDAHRAMKLMSGVARELATEAYEVKVRHEQLYSALHEVRKGRREKTPKPGFFS